MPYIEDLTREIKSLPDQGLQKLQGSVERGIDMGFLLIGLTMAGLWATNTLIEQSVVTPNIGVSALILEYTLGTGFSARRFIPNLIKGSIAVPELEKRELAMPSKRGYVVRLATRVDDFIRSDKTK